MSPEFPRLVLADWRGTRDALHAYARVLGQVRRELTPYQKHWWHITLHAAARGLTTTPIPAGSKTVELMLSPVRDVVEITTSEGNELTEPVSGQSQRAFSEAVCGALEELGVRCAPPTELADIEYDYASDAARAYWRALAQIDYIYKEFKGGLREETGPVQIFPHHFDLSMNWFSGRLVPGVDPADEESADEQMNFGFVTGDASIAEAYFYVTAYPLPEGFTAAALPEGAYWHTEGFTGAILPYEALVGAPDPRASLLEFLRTSHRAGSDLMQ